jgi:hypothetical protein
MLNSFLRLMRFKSMDQPLFIYNYQVFFLDEYQKFRYVIYSCSELERFGCADVHSFTNMIEKLPLFRFFICTIMTI